MNDQQDIQVGDKVNVRTFNFRTLDSEWGERKYEVVEICGTRPHYKLKGNKRLYRTEQLRKVKA